MKTAFRKSVQKYLHETPRPEAYLSSFQLSIPFEVCIIRLSWIRSNAFPASEALQNLAVQNAVSPWDESNVCRSQLLSQDVRSLNPGLGHNLTLWLRRPRRKKGWMAVPASNSSMLTFSVSRAALAVFRGRPHQHLVERWAQVPGAKTALKDLKRSRSTSTTTYIYYIYIIYIYIICYMLYVIYYILYILYFIYIRGISEKKHQDC